MWQSSSDFYVTALPKQLIKQQIMSWKEREQVRKENVAFSGDEERQDLMGSTEESWCPLGEHLHHFLQQMETCSTSAPGQLEVMKPAQIWR